MLSGPVDPNTPASSVAPVTTIVPPPPPPIDPEWKERIESELASLRDELAELKAQLGI